MHRVLLILLALLIAAPSVAIAQAYRCGSEGETHSECCCPEQEPPEAPSIERACCCEVIEGVAPASKEGLAPPAKDAPHAVAALVPPVALATAIPPVGMTAAARPRSARGSPPLPSRLFVTHCSLLL